jgi:amino acid permease
MYLVLAWFPLLTLLSWIRTLEKLGKVTLLGNFFILASVIIVLVASGIQVTDNLSVPDLSDDDGNDDDGGHHDAPALDVQWYFVPSTFAVMLGTSIYAFEGIGTGMFRSR